MRRTGRIIPLSAGLVSALAAALAPSPASAQAQTPEGAWEIEKTAERCTLYRALGGADPAAVSVTTDPGSDLYRLTVAAKTLPHHPTGRFPTAVILHGPEKRFGGMAMAGQLGGAFPQALQIDDITPGELATLSGAKAISLSFKGGAVGPLALPDLAEAVAAFGECNGEHLVAMGADARQFKPGGAAPVAVKPRDTWFGFPQIMEIAKAAGPAAATGGLFTLVVDGAGKVENCTRRGAQGDDAYQKAACATLLNKTMFRPAHDPAGNPVKGIATFVIPPMPGPPPRR